MESSNGKEAEEKSNTDQELETVSNAEETKLGSKVGSMSTEEMYFRADTIDFKSWDVQLEKHLSRAWSRDSEVRSTRKEEWEIELGKLDIRHVIAYGTYGTVYRGNYDGQDVAVKVLDWGEDGIATAVETAALRASFKQEVAVWHKLDHPNVTKFVGASMGTSNLKIPSQKIFLFRNRRKKLAFKIVIQLALDLSRGLSYLHSKKIVHRDVKTENMLLDATRTLKIADFGVARVEAQNPRDMTGETGTLGYMAPEVLDGKPYNRKCDVYSFGICLWEIYCSDMPYPDLSFAEVSSAVVRQHLRPEIPRCCPSSFASVMRKCWDANPEKRPEMDEVVRLLEAIDTSKGGGMLPEDQSTGCLKITLQAPQSRKNPQSALALFDSASRQPGYTHSSHIFLLILRRLSDPKLAVHVTRIVELIKTHKYLLDREKREAFREGEGWICCRGEKSEGREGDADENGYFDGEDVLGIIFNGWNFLSAATDLADERPPPPFFFVEVGWG
ncbi:SERINE/THREONINE-PROTEIN KINASE TNNI3K-RELATED [Salix koriyanagi]|uniref:non-specific serine/threonine protein kinase n=1 Tax=Salix koriyanagi TaxID=2511006 RepID=A0A9Q0QMJ6_9ROSI|nr:SERINE/THREONINE-PROTEIN KINASE TNNI3K-RELATED [Salix koriyanagi]